PRDRSGKPVFSRFSVRKSFVSVCCSRENGLSGSTSSQRLTPERNRSHLLGMELKPLDQSKHRKNERGFPSLADPGSQERCHGIADSGPSGMPSSGTAYTIQVRSFADATGFTDWSDPVTRIAT